MSDEIAVQVLASLPAEVVQDPAAVEAPLPDQATPEEARAIEAAFAQEQESHLVAGLLGMYTGALVLHDVAKETFSSSEEEKSKKKKKDEKEKR